MNQDGKECCNSEAKDAAAGNVQVANTGTTRLRLVMELVAVGDVAVGIRIIGVVS